MDESSVGNENVGSIALWRIPTPKLHIFGHIHEGYGSFTDVDCRYLNASIVDFFYDPVNRPFVVEW
jgi:Icc-related predicted phosphoesterase